MGMEGTPPSEQQAVQAETAAEAASAQQADSDTFLLDAQIAEGLNNIDVIRCVNNLSLAPCVVLTACTQAPLHRCRPDVPCTRLYVQVLLWPLLQGV